MTMEQKEIAALEEAIALICSVGIVDKYKRAAFPKNAEDKMHCVVCYVTGRLRGLEQKLINEIEYQGK